jgi:hypothetical protein
MQEEINVKMQEEIEEMLDYLTKLTKEQGDFIEHVLKWPLETRLAFVVAKKILDDSPPKLKTSEVNR